MTKYLAFDLEIFKSIPAGETDWKRHRPLGISCAATWASDKINPILWYEEMGGALPRTRIIQLNIIWFASQAKATRFLPGMDSASTSTCLGKNRIWRRCALRLQPTM